MTLGNVFTLAAAQGNAVIDPDDVVRVKGARTGSNSLSFVPMPDPEPLVLAKAGASFSIDSAGDFTFDPGTAGDGTTIGQVVNVSFWVDVFDGRDDQGNPDNLTDKLVKLTFPVAGTKPANVQPAFEGTAASEIEIVVPI